MAQTESKKTNKIPLILLFAILFIALGGLFYWYTQKQPPPPPLPPPIVQSEPVPEPIPEPITEPIPEPVMDASAREAIPEPRIPARIRRRPRRRRFYRRRKPKKRVKPIKRIKPKPIPVKRIKPKPVPVKRIKPRPKPVKRIKPKPPKPVFGKVNIWHVKQMTGPFEFLRVEYTLDGKVVYKSKDGGDVQDKFRFYQGMLSTGKHVLFADIYLRGIGFGAFASLNSMRIQLRSALPFVVKPNEVLTIEVFCSENKRLTLKKRLSVKYKKMRKELPPPPNPPAQDNPAPPAQSNPTPPR